ncbi:MAG: hypothetical protein R3C02_24395 [Planctomycetaceae bacterium]
MLPWLVILLRSLLPIDLAAQILPPDLSIAEDAPFATVIGKLEPTGDGPANLDLIASIPGGVISFDPVTTEVSVADSAKLDTESSRRIVLFLRETRTKSPDLYRSLFVDQLLKNGASPRNLERFTTDVRFRICVVAVTEVEEQATILPEGDPIAEGGYHANSHRQLFTTGLEVAAIPEGLASPKSADTFEIDPLVQVQAYLDRVKLSKNAVNAQEQSKDQHVVATVTSPDDTPDSIGETERDNLSQEVAETAVEATVIAPIATPSQLPSSDDVASAPSPSLPVVTKVQSPPDRSDAGAAGKNTASSFTHQHARRDAMWLIAGLLPLFPLICFGVVFAWNVLKHARLIGRLSGCFNRQNEATSTIETLDVDEIIEVQLSGASQDLDESDLTLLKSGNNSTTSDDAAALMSQCLQALESLNHPVDSLASPCETGLNTSGLNLSDDLILEPTTAAVDSSEQSSVPRSQERGHSLREAAAGLVSEANVYESETVEECERSRYTSDLEDEASSTSIPSIEDLFRSGPPSIDVQPRTGSDALSEVDRLRRLIQDEFGIAVKNSPDQQNSTTNPKPRVKLEPPPPIDLGEFREISEAAFRQAIVTSRTNVRHRQIRHLLTYSAIVGSLVCAIASIVLSPHMRIPLLMVSVSAFAVLGYLKSRRPPEEDT